MGYYIYYVERQQANAGGIWATRLIFNAPHISENVVHITFPLASPFLCFASFFVTPPASSLPHLLTLILCHEKCSFGTD